MTTRCFSPWTSHLVAGVSLFGLLIAGCNKQPSAPANGPATEAPPIAALPLAAAAPSSASPAPPASALPPAPRQIPYVPPPPNERYRYIDRAYSMGDAFADTPPDYTVDYEGTRPWIWRAENGAYRIVERLPRSERIYYYDPGQDQPFLIQDPDYSYAYDGGELVAVYGPDGRELAGPMAARRADEASRYFDRSRELYRVAQYERRQSAYASEWALRRDELRAEHRMWEEQQARNADWRAWHDEHEAEEARQWRQEHDQRLAYAAAIGIPVTSPGPFPRPDEVARRQAAYFSSWNAAHGGAASTKVAVSGASPTGAPQTQTQSRAVGLKNAVPPIQQIANPQQKEVAAAQTKVLKTARAQQAAQAQQAAAEAKRKEAAAAEAKAAQVAQAQQAAAEAKRRETAAAQIKTAQAAQAKQAEREAKRKQAAAAEAKAAQAAQAQKAAAEANRKEAAAAEAKAVQAAQAQQAAAEAKRKEAAAAEVKATQAAKAQQAADEAKRKEAAAAEAKAAQAAHAQQLEAEAKHHDAAVAQARAAQAAPTPKSQAEAHSAKPAPGATKPAIKSAKRANEEKKDHQQVQQQ